MPTSRLYFLDWVRILAFMLLILYHTGMYYVSWDWHVKSPFANSALEPFMQMSSPWRLSLLFLISGVASGYMLMKISALRFMRERSVRLLVPLVFGMFVIVPPQAYFEVVEKVAYQGSYTEFMQLYVTSYRGFCRGDDCLDMPTWNHLWFVAYLWVYTLALGALMLALGKRWQTMAQRIVPMLTGWRLIALPVLVLAVARIALSRHFPTTHDLVNDWFMHAVYFFLFLLGAMLAHVPAVWERFGAARWWALGLASASWAGMMIFYAWPDALVPPAHLPVWQTLLRTVYALCTWSAIVAAIGFAQRHLNRDSANRQYLAQAVFPVYILHQTLIVSMAYLLKPAKITPAVEGLILIVLTLCISFAAVEIIRRVAWLRPLFGMLKADQPRPALVTAVPMPQALSARN